MKHATEAAELTPGELLKEYEQLKGSYKHLRKHCCELKELIIELWPSLNEQVKAAACRLSEEDGRPCHPEDYLGQVVLGRAICEVR